MEEGREVDRKGVWCVWLVGRRGGSGVGDG